MKQFGSAFPRLFIIGLIFLLLESCITDRWITRDFKFENDSSWDISLYLEPETGGNTTIFVPQGKIITTAIQAPKYLHIGGFTKVEIQFSDGKIVYYNRIDCLEESQESIPNPLMSDDYSFDNDGTPLFIITDDHHSLAQ